MTSENAFFVSWEMKALFRTFCGELPHPLETYLRQQDNAGGKIFPYGSYGMGVHSKGGDMDALCAGPQFIGRKCFFTSFVEKLKAEKEVVVSYVPVIKLTFQGIEIDLVYIQLAQRTIPENRNLLDDRVAKDLELPCIRSLNGYRVAEEILRLVPNVQSFRITLKAIKLWAKREFNTDLGGPTAHRGDCELPVLCKKS